MSLVADYPNYTQARTHLKDVFDDAKRGRTVTLQRDNDVVAVTAVDRLRDYFARTVSSRVSVTREDGIVIATMEGRPFASEGATITDALDELVEALREYAEDWDERLQYAPNHRDAWGLVQLVRLSSDEQLKDWMSAGGE
ncbi:Antitoxin of toxin-antitoxin, RelE / RelB, TA system [Paramicrobacterium humi]|uniref:Antitoxin of toxin-antitoxin, RelE / RelB, TA system n=1 Tax=Paramicrobacterium humi TaxID=640635 RepID=A0A1H4KC86_9MICO|nr:hypothetical protein [Microbacterium humi]SEB56043.1 Antitoxin of toxin-antitoxin, RelE / RelB, TA system [Microbacterium humi]